MSYRPICDTWLLARSKVKFYGAYPAGFLQRARDLLGVSINDPVLHVCAGNVREYPFWGFGPWDKTLDLDPACSPDFCQDARQPFPSGLLKSGEWAGVLIDRPYSPEDADHYAPGRSALPAARQLLVNGLAVVPVGGKVGILDYVAPRPPKGIGKFVACVGVVVGFENRIRVFSVYRRIA